MTPKQQQFILEYLIDRNATQAAIRAGYSKNSAKQIGAENLTKHVILTEIIKAIEERSEKTKVDAEWILTELQSVYDEARADHDKPSALRALDLAGKHVDVQAYKDKVDIVHRMTHEEALDTLDHGSDSAADNHTTH